MSNNRIDITREAYVYVLGALQKHTPVRVNTVHAFTLDDGRTIGTTTVTGTVDALYADMVDGVWTYSAEVFTMGGIQ